MPQRQAAIYVRISEDREGAGLGVARQQSDCVALAIRKGWPSTLHRHYVDNDVSASNGKPRPAYERMLRDIEAGDIGLLVAWHADRIYRRPIELEHLINLIEAAGVQVVTVRAGDLDLSIPSGRMVARILGAQARYETEHHVERLKRKYLQLAQDGRDAGGGRPFGYEADRKTIRPAEARHIREAAQRVLAGASLRSICTDWSDRGIASVNGGRWSSQVVKRILTSARISGRREYTVGPNGRRLTLGRITSDQAEYGSIITVDESDRLRSLLHDPGRNMLAGRARAYLLTGGIARCGACGAALVARPKADKRRCYVCASGPNFRGCGKIRQLADPLEALITEAVLQAVDAGALAAAMHQDHDDDTAEELVKVENKLAELARGWAEDRISRVEWEASRGTLINRQQALQRRIERQRRAYGLDHLQDPLREAWPALPLPTRRSVIGLLIEQVIVKPAIKGRNFFDPDRIEVRWRV